MIKTLSGCGASQKEDELNRFKAIISENKCESYLEIGARDGDTFYEIVKLLPKSAIAIAVDLPGGLWGAKRSKQNLEMCVYQLKREGYKNVKCIFGDSTSQELINRISKRRYDAMLIDGDHRYDGVKKDWDNYGHLATKIVAFHDIAGVGVIQKTTGHLVEVPKLWNEIKDSYKHEEIISSIKEKPMGIGVLFV